MSATTSLTPALSPRRGRNICRVLENTSGGIGRTVRRIMENMIRKILSSGERTQVRADDNIQFKRSHKAVIVLTLQEILDEPIAKWLV